MAVNKNFVVKNGLEVADNLIFAENQKVGIGTTSPQYNLDVKGDVALTGTLLVPSEVSSFSTTGVANSLYRTLITGVNTSLYRVNDIIDDGAGGLFANNTKVTFIGISSVGISPQHTLLVGESSVSYTVRRTLTSGESEQVLVSRGDVASPVWKIPSAKSIVNSSSSPAVQYIPFVSGTGSTFLGINQNQLSFIPSLGNLGLGTNNPTSKLWINGDAYLSGIITSNGASISNVSIGLGNTEFIVDGNFRLVGIATIGDNNNVTINNNIITISPTSNIIINADNNTITVGNNLTLNENQISLGDSILVGSSGIITALQFVGTATTSATSTILSLNSNNKFYPTFVSGTGNTSLGIKQDKIHFIPNSGYLGIGTDVARFNLDVIGTVGIDGLLYAPTEQPVYTTKSATINSSNRSFVGINTSNILVGDIIDDGIGGRLSSNTKVTSVGISSVGISPQHTLLVGSETIQVQLTRGDYITPGNSGYILVSGGSTMPMMWKSTATVIDVGITTSTENKNYNLVFTEKTEEKYSGLNVSETGLFFNPSTNSLGIGKTSPTESLDVVGNANFTGNVTADYFVGIASTSIDVIGGIASVTKATVGTEVTIEDGDVTAINYYGSGVNLVGIVTNLVPGIGVNLTPSQTPGNKGEVKIDAYRPTGKTIFVNQNGNDDNTGLSENHAKRTIKAAAYIAVFGDTIKVYPGTYVEENPIILKKTVSVEGTELRNCIVTPKYPYLDLFHVNNGCHITDMSFIGPEMTDGASVVALQPLEGVAVDRYFDAARMIRLNLDYIANEAVGFLTSTQYIGAGRTQVSDPVFEVVNSSGIATDTVNCSDDIKSIFKCIIHDITRGGNSKSIQAGKSYYDDEYNLLHITGTDPNGYSVKEATIDAIKHAEQISRAVVNNVTWGSNPVGFGTTVTNALYDSNTGITTITALNHGLLKDDAVKIVGLGFTCPSGAGIVTYPSGTYGYIFNVLNVVNNDNFEVIVGQSTLPHTYVSGGTIQKYESFSHDTYQVKDLAIQKDPLTGFNNGINGCANVISAIHSCVGIITNIIGLGSTAFGTVGIKTTYPGNAGIGFTTVIGITSAVYDEVSGKTTIEASGINIKEGELVELRDLEFSCGSTGSISTQRFHSGAYGYQFYVDKIYNDGKFDVYVGPSTLPHSYVGGGVAVNRAVAVTTAIYNNVTGITTITVENGFIETGDLIRLRELEFSCTSGAGTTTIYPTGNEGYDFKVLDIVIDKPFSISTATYSNTTGIVTITAPGITLSQNDIVELRNLEFSCPDSPPNLIYPSGKNGYKFKVLSSIGSTFTVNVGTSSKVHTYVSGGTAANKTQTSSNTFTIQVGVSTIPHTYVSGGIVIPPYSPGVGPITQGPYVRNCTNFIPKSIGMKVDGFAAEPGDTDDIGVTGTMSVDSYTQYNQGGIGVSITNGAYSQLVSIFTICDDIAIFTGSGGQCDITNSNSSFGRLGLVSDGVGDKTSKSIYRYTGIAATTASAEQSIITVSGIGNYRPYDGQTLYFGELFYTVQRVDIIDGGSGYTSPPTIVFESPPGGVNGIRAEGIANIENGKVVSVDLISTGTQYRNPPLITITGGGGSGAKAVSIMSPIYYTIESATLPSAGISTITLNTNLNNTVSTGTTVYFTRLSLQIVSSHSFEWVGSGNDIFKAKPSLGGVVIQENEVVKLNGGECVYTSTDQAGNFRIGDGLVVNQLTGTVSGRAFNQSLINTVTPLIIALGN